MPRRLNRKVALTTLALAVLLSMFLVRRTPTAARQTAAITPSSAPAVAAGRIDAVARLQQKIDSGAVTLTFDGGTLERFREMRGNRRRVLAESFERPAVLAA